MRWFYLALGLLAIAGVAVIWAARGSSDEDTAPAVGPLAVSAGDFEGHILGSDSAPVVVIEYSAFECGWCARFALLTKPDVRERLIRTGIVQWRFRDFPTTGEWKGDAAHLAAACAGEQGRFWPMHDQIFYNQGRWARESKPDRMFRDYARAAGVDLGQYDRCFDERRYLGRIEATKQGGLALGVQSTPTFIINGTKVLGYKAFDDFRELVQQALPSEGE